MGSMNVVQDASCADDQANSGIVLTRKIRVVDASALVQKMAPERRFHVHPLVPANDVTMLSGDGGTGKSLLALQLAVATVTGGKWCGSGVTMGGVLYLSAEDDENELHRRLEAIVRFEGASAEQLEGLRLIPLAGEDALMAVEAVRGGDLKPTPLYKRFEKLIDEFRPKLVVIDTLADVFGGSEIDRRQARQFVGMLRHFALRYDCAVLVLSHPSLSGLSSGSGTSGSTAWNNSVRSRLYLEAEKARSGYECDPNVRILRTQKANYGPIGGKVVLRWRNGVFTLVNGAESTALQCAAHARADKVFMTLLIEHTAEGKNLSPYPNASTYAPSAFAKDPRNDGIRKGGFVAAMERLLAGKKIMITKSSGAPSRQKDIIVPSG